MVSFNRLDTDNLVTVPEEFITPEGHSGQLSEHSKKSVSHIRKTFDACP